jgi:hypothetical protein
MKHFLGFLLASLVAQTVGAQTKCAPAVPADICQFESKVYTETDFKDTAQVASVVHRLKELLMSHATDSSLIQERLLNLADQINEEAYRERAPKDILARADGQPNTLEMLKSLKAWEAVHGQIVPLDWHLPAGFTIAVSNMERSFDVTTGRVRFGLSFFAILEKPLEIEQLQVAKYGGAVVIDKAAGIGSWNEGTILHAHISASSSLHEVPLENGLYTFIIKVKGQPPMSGWYYLHGTSATSPVVFTPQVNEKLRGPNPTLSFQDFRSDVVAPADYRKRSVQISRDGEGEVWRTDIINPAPSTQVVVGRAVNQQGVSELASGAYRLNLVFEERSYFGDMLIGRLSNTTVPFSVTK